MQDEKIETKRRAEQRASMRKKRKKEEYWHVNPIGNKYILIYFTNYKDDPRIYMKFALYISHHIVHVLLVFLRMCFFFPSFLWVSF